MTQTRLTLTCSDLHPGCPAVLRGGDPDALVLGYVLHAPAQGHCPDVELDELLAAVAVAPARPERLARA